MYNKHEYVAGIIYGCRELINVYNNGVELIAITKCVYCGKESKIRARQLFNEKYTSCRCRIKTVDGLNRSRIYQIFHNMHYRCNTSTSAAYKRYGAKGIKICEEWSGNDGFMRFYEWAMENGYEDNLTIDRIDNHGDYSPDNCRWVTKSENTTFANKTCQHRRANRGTYFGVDQNGILHTFENAAQFCREHPEFKASRLRSCANKRLQYNGWTFGFLSDLESQPCEPQSTIERALNA